MSYSLVECLLHSLRKSLSLIHDENMMMRSEKLYFSEDDDITSDKNMLN